MTQSFDSRGLPTSGNVVSMPKVAEQKNDDGNDVQINTDHLHALYVRLSNERERLASAQSENEREMRSVWVAGIEKEIDQERLFLGLPKVTETDNVSDDALLEQLGM